MVRTAEKAATRRQAPSATAYVALFALAVLQLGVVLHHDQHSATDLTSTCVACIQFEQFDDLVPAAGTGFVIDAAYALSTTPAAAVPAARLLRLYNSRAPPLLHS